MKKILFVVLGFAGLGHPADIIVNTMVEEKYL